jgi:hypothetical protein
MADPIRIGAPDGTIVEFPAGTGDDVIRSVMAKSFPPPAAAPTPAIDDPMGTGVTSSQPVQAQMPYGEQMAHVGRALDNAVRLAANGATFGLADKFAGGMDAITGRAKSYDEGVKAQRAETETLRKASPGVALLAEAAGGLTSGAGLVKSGVTLAGRVGSGLFPRILGYGAEGAAYGAAHGAGSTYSDKASDYIENAKHGATTGALIGGGLPILGAAAGNLYRAGSAFLGPRVEGAGRGASALLRAAAQADEAGLRALPEMGDAAMLVDAGPSMLGLGQGAATGSGPGRTLLSNALRQRDAGTGARLADAVENAVGPAPTPSHIEAGLAADRGRVAEAYGPVFEQVGPVDNRVLARQLDIMAHETRGPAQRTLNQVREMLNLPNSDILDRNPHTLLATRNAIDGMMKAEASNPQVVGQLTAARRLVDAQLARNVPGIKQVDARYEELARQSDALARGGQVFDVGKEAIRPIELAEEIQRQAIPGGLQVGPPAERAVESAFVGPSAAPFRMRQGARAELDRVVGTQVNDLLALERTLATPQDWNSQKFATVFGEDARRQVADAIMNNRRMREAYQYIVHNAQTAQRLEAARQMTGAEGGNVPHDLTATSLGLKAVNMILKAMSGASNASTKNQIGEILATRGPEVNAIGRELLASAQATGNNARAIARLLSDPRWTAGVVPAADRR